MFALVLAACLLAMVSTVAVSQASDDGETADAPRVTVAPVGSISLAPTAHQPTVRIKDIARFDGVRDNQLFGMGLVIGLEGTGDGRGSQANVQMVANMLERFGITVDRDALRLRN